MKNRMLMDSLLTKSNISDRSQLWKQPNALDFANEKSDIKEICNSLTNFLIHGIVVDDC